VIRASIVTVTLAALAVNAAAQSAEPVVRGKNLIDDRSVAVRAAVGRATYQGTRARGVAVFKGIPYAKPPVGSLRWKPPVAIEPTGNHRATEFGARCIQSDRLDAWTRSIARVFGTEDRVVPSRLATSEDCLTLNIWTANPAGRAPVMVWIHGGSNLNGSGAEPLYDGSELARRGVVVVTINYRLGMLGFMAHPALVAESPNHSAGNYGLLDQLEALRWVRNHIGSFGGDPGQVTVFGESAGSIDLMHLMASPLAKGLFERAIAESGAPMGRMGNLTVAGGFGRMFARALGVDSSGDVLAALRAKPAAAVLAAQNDFPPLVLAAGPVVDGWVLPDMTARIFQRGEQADVPMIIGSNDFEMTTLRSYLPTFPRTVAGYRQWVGQTLGGAAEAVLAYYTPADDQTVEETALHLTTDLFMTCPVRIAARAMSRSGRKTYRYLFTRVLPGGESLGAYHAAELGYVFGVTLPWLPREPVDDRLSRTMMGYWTRFAKTGDPNGGGDPAWPSFDGAEDPFLELGSAVVAHRNLKQGPCDAMDPPIKAQWAGK
jgi:para-nitrobenzyl esterase